MIPIEERNGGAAGPIEFVDLYQHRKDLKRQLAVVQHSIERCQHDWQYVPETKFEDRGGVWARVSFRTCCRCGMVNERVDSKPREALGQWDLTAKFRDMKERGIE